MFQQLNQEEGITVILVTHDAGVAQHAKRVIRISDGAISNGTFTGDQEPVAGIRAGSRRRGGLHDETAAVRSGRPCRPCGET